MNSKYALAISLLACSATCQAKRVDSTHKRLYPIALTLSVDALGKVSKLACKPTVPESLCPAMVRTVSAWKFAPGLVAGQPTAMDAVLTLNLLATRKGEGFELHAADASILQAAPAVLASALAEPRQQTPPRYPPDEMRKGSHGTVVIELLIVPGSDTPRVGSTWFDHELKPGYRTGLPAKGIRVSLTP